VNRIIIRISVRNLLRNKFTSLICVSGLSVGFTAFILISLFIRYELSWDKANENYDNIYLIQRNTATSTGTGPGDLSPFTPAITASLVGEFAGLENAAAIHGISDRFLSFSPGEQVRIEQGLYADNNFLDIFTWHFLEGSQEGSLSDPFSVLISESLAARFFKPGKAVGQILTLDRKTDLKVSGVYADLPLNSSIRPEYIISFKTLENTGDVLSGSIWSVPCMTFVRLKPDSDTRAFAAGIEGLLTGFDGMEAETLRLNPLSRIRIESVPDYYTTLWVFGLTGLFILFMSAFNYINLTIANAATRGKEIAVKKMNGSGRSGLVFQFMGETLFLSAMAIIFSFFIVTLVLPFYNGIMNTAISLDIFRDSRFLGLMTAGSLLTGLLAGVYPALFMSSNSIISLFKGAFKTGNDRMGLHRILVLFQFSISVFLICLSLFFLIQVNHLAGKNIGFDRENLVYVRLTSSEQGRSFEDFRNRLLKHPEIINASKSENLPFVNFGSGRISWEGNNPGDLLHYRPNFVSYDFIDNLGMDLIAGRAFSRDFPSDVSGACIINKTAARYFGWDDPVGMRVDNNRYTVIGVVDDYHVMDIHNIIPPVVLKLGRDEMTGEQIYTFRHKPGSGNEVISILSDEFSREFPNDPFETGELETAFLNEPAFRTYQTIKRSVLLFTVFSIFLAVTGILGLVSFNVVRRTKEIGIRKINGSSTRNIFLILNRDFFVLLGISIAIAWPGAWMVHQALPGVYKLPLHPWIMVISAFIITVIILLATTWQTLNAAARNPVESLRYE
jgi:putative ABC transport system permease protein